MLPTASDSAASTHTAGRQSERYRGKATPNTRSSAANPAALVADDMKAVTGVGAPWYTSGVHMWNGTAATLKPSPTSRSANPARSVPCSKRVFWARNWPIPMSEVVDVAPYVSATPYRKIADEKAPSTKYF